MKKKMMAAMLALVACLAAVPAGFVKRAASAPRPVVTALARDLAYRSRELVVPAAAPANLDDPRIMEAWVRLYNHTEPIALWDDRTLTGRDLARYMLDNGIPVAVDTQHACGNFSCSVLYRRGQLWTYEDGKPGVDPILAPPADTIEMADLVLTLGHEIFHRMQLFGPAPDTRYEEYWAFKLEAQLSGAGGLKFAGYDPLVSADLTRWIHDNGVDGYMKLPEYPAQALSLVAQ